jgi:hypothetical protein
MSKRVASHGDVIWRGEFALMVVLEQRLGDELFRYRIIKQPTGQAVPNHRRNRRALASEKRIED